ncbi:MAG: 4-hydroxy-tetrahydrodipicolinate synthase [Treponema sp.]|nr:4-hydroxy-tetrahydrodipicolinate synthase [Treponema sp.]MCL2251102.1 4-hydroxy-tetrahydrodipicolinate synthase [Treponema sp.]
MTEFRGAFTALVTPMKESGEIDYDGFHKLIEFQIKEGIDGIVPLGTTGENPTLDESEEEKLIEIAVKDAKGKIPVIVGAGSNDTRHMIKYAERAKKMGADAALVVTPYYNKPNDDGLLRHFEEAAKVGIPIIVYNIASRTGRNIPIALMKEIAKIPGICGVKESSQDIVQIGDIIREIALPRKNTKDKFWVLSGDDPFTLPLISMGGEGVISVISNLVPAKVKALTSAALKGDLESARAIHYELVPLIKAAFIETNPVPIKQALCWAGLPAGPARLPLGKLSNANAEVLRKTLKDMGII